MKNNLETNNSDINYNNNQPSITKFSKVIEFLKGIGTILLFYIIGTIATLLLSNTNQSSNIVIATISQIGTYLIILVSLGLIYHKRLINDFKNFKKANCKIALKNWLLGLIFMMIANLIITTIVENIPANESANRELLQAFPVSNIIIMVLIGPMVEEITFRASLKNAFTKWYTFALASGLLFGLAHIAEYNLLEFFFVIPYGALGFFFAKAFYETDNIYTSYLAHFLHNGMCIILLLIM